MKRIFTLISLLVIASQLLVACGPAATPVPATQAPKAAEPTKPPAPKKITLTF